MFRINEVPVAALVGVCVALSGCDASSYEAVGPEAISASSIENATGMDLARASGHVELQGTTLQNIREESISFTAIATGPSATGQVQVHAVRFTGVEFEVHATVTCLSVEGSSAWIGTRVDRFVLNGTEINGPVGRPMVFTVRDMGEGQGVIDLASLAFFPSNGDDFTHCDTHPAIPVLRASARGNVSVASD